MNETQLQAHGLLMTEVTGITHSIIDRITGGEWEFSGNQSGWIQAHVIASEINDDLNEILKSCSQTIPNEVNGYLLTYLQTINA
jgi:hypothetical protein